MSGAGRKCDCASPHPVQCANYQTQLRATGDEMSWNRCGCSCHDGILDTDTVWITELLPKQEPADDRDGHFSYKRGTFTFTGRDGTVITHPVGDIVFAVEDPPPPPLGELRTITLTCGPAHVSGLSEWLARHCHLLAGLPRRQRYRWFRGRIGEPYDKTIPKLRKSQRRAWRRFRFEANRDLRQQGCSTVFRVARLRDSIQFDRRRGAVFYASVDSRLE